ncbi:hypothetical protein RHGRI_027974 [Rhododendron griersonianum]|uniref:Glycosyltransferase N-terminal domain-containing protein n=1 Tax=Rhododendron griersonianum TaxID=479676 RepID=A0AAV6IYJ7_9ERIC|nr:hypothetical protein RHGRI_027974 [Rhododendron griersonianum]
MDSKQSTITVIMFPWLAHGHISPFLELAKKLSTRNFKIYLCSTPVNLTSIKSKLTETKYSASIELVELPLPTDNLPAESHTTKGLPLNLMPTLKQAFDSVQEDFSKLLQKLEPDLLIYDFLQPWAPDLASSYNIPAVDFITSSATMTAYMQHHYLYRVPEWEFKSIYFREYDNVDRSHLLNPPLNLNKDKTRCFDCLEKSNDIVLIKSFKEVEGKYIDYLSKLVGKKEVGVGMEVVRDENGRVDRERVAEVIKKVVVECDGDGVRQKARELSQVLGSKGEEDIDVVVEELVKLFLKKKKMMIRSNGST